MVKNDMQCARGASANEAIFRTFLKGGASALALGCMLGSPIAYAQDADSAEEPEQAAPADEGLIIVSGIRQSLANSQDIIGLQEAAKSVYVDRLVRQYIVSLTEATRNHREVSLGASPRASLGLFRTSRALALIRDRDYVIPDDIKELAAGVIAHRLMLSPSARMRGVQSTDVVEDLLTNVPVPGATR